MSKLNEWLSRSCLELDLSLESLIEISLPNGVQFRNMVLIPNLGSQKGILILNSFDDLKGQSTAFKNAGYGYSVLGEPYPNETYDIESFKEMYRDWGWFGDPIQKPSWM